MPGAVDMNFTQNSNDPEHNPTPFHWHLKKLRDLVSFHQREHRLTLLEKQQLFENVNMYVLFFQ